MSDKKLSILALIAAVLVFLTALQSRLMKPSQNTAASPSNLIQGINPDTIHQIVLGTGENAVKFTRSGGGFVLSGKDDYPASAKEINDLITKVLDIQASEKRTSNKDNHADLEVTEEKAKHIIQFLDKDQKPIAGIVIGKRDAQSGGTYVRLMNSDDVYLCLDVPWIRTGALDYTQKEILNVPSSDIARVSVISTDRTYSIKADENNQPVLEDIPDGKVAKDTDYKQVFNALSSLSFEDVQKSAENLTFDHSYLCRLKNSTVYTLKLAVKDNKTYATISAKFMDTTPVVKEKREETEEELKKKEAILLAHEAANKFTQQHEGWVYVLPDWKAKNLTKKFEELIKDKDKEEPKAEEKPAEEPKAKEIPASESSAPASESPAAPASESPGSSAAPGAGEVPATPAAPESSGASEAPAAPAVPAVPPTPAEAPQTPATPAP